jgi:hypothetical protein
MSSYSSSHNNRTYEWNIPKGNKINTYVIYRFFLFPDDFSSSRFFICFILTRIVCNLFKRDYFFVIIKCVIIVKWTDRLKAWRVLQQSFFYLYVSTRCSSFYLITNSTLFSYLFFFFFFDSDFRHLSLRMKNERTHGILLPIVAPVIRLVEDNR